MINVANSTSCILLKQQSKGIILHIIVFRCELIPKRYTRINHLGVFVNESNGVHHLIIESLLYILIALMKFWTVWSIFFKAWEIFQLSQKLLIDNMTPIYLCTSISVLNFRLEYNHNTKQHLLNFLVCQFLRAHQINYLQIICVITITLIIFEYTNNQQTHIRQWINIQQHSTPWKLVTSCSLRTWSEQWNCYHHV